MNYLVVFHSEVDLEFREAFIWYELRFEGLGIRFNEAIQKCLKRIETNPEAFAKKKAGFREVLVENFPT